jgi:antitoxin (DNA-binding transcriptional repressor) of toxin-antitoxin stability system
MQAVNIRELKARLSHYLREVRSGHVVWVTDRGTVVAEIRPPTVDERALRRTGLQHLADKGVLRYGAPRDREVYGSSAVRLDATAIDEALDFVRGDR